MKQYKKDIKKVTSEIQELIKEDVWIWINS